MSESKATSIANKLGEWIKWGVPLFVAALAFLIGWVALHAQAHTALEKDIEFCIGRGEVIETIRAEVQQNGKDLAAINAYMKGIDHALDTISKAVAKP